MNLKFTVLKKKNETVWPGDGTSQQNVRSKLYRVSGGVPWNQSLTRIRIFCQGMPQEQGGGEEDRARRSCARLRSGVVSALAWFTLGLSGAQITAWNYQHLREGNWLFCTPDQSVIGWGPSQGGCNHLGKGTPVRWGPFSRPEVERLGTLCSQRWRQRGAWHLHSTGSWVRCQ